MQEKLGETVVDPLKEQCSPNELPTAAETHVLYELHQQNQRCSRSGENCDVKTLDTLHKNIAHCECYPLFSDFVSGKIPSVERMMQSVMPALEKAKKELETEVQKDGDKDSKNLLAMVTLLAGRQEQIKSSVRHYVQSVIRFRELERIALGGIRDVTKQFEQADHARRRAHDNLIKSVEIYSSTMHTVAFEDLIPNTLVAEWSLGEDARSISPDKAIVFSAVVLRNRDFIRDWAIAFDFAEQLKALGDEHWLRTVRDRSK